MQYLTSDDIVFIHDEIVEKTGGSLGVREPGLLVSIANKPQTSFGDTELYPDIFTKAAALYEALCNYHVFIDGNKRVSAIIAYRFLAINGYNLTATNKQLEDYTVSIATKNPDIEAVAAWLKKHSRKSIS
jgi:death-on-curing protein